MSVPLTASQKKPILTIHRKPHPPHHDVWHASSSSPSSPRLINPSSISLPPSPSHQTSEIYDANSSKSSGTKIVIRPTRSAGASASDSSLSSAVAILPPVLASAIGPVIDAMSTPSSPSSSSVGLPLQVCPVPSDLPLTPNVFPLSTWTSSFPTFPESLHHLTIDEKPPTSWAGLSASEEQHVLSILSVYSLGLAQLVQAVRSAMDKPVPIVANMWKMLVFLLHECMPDGKNTTYDLNRYTS